MMRVCMFLINNIYYDARVQKEAISLIQHGYEVDLITLVEKEIHHMDTFKGIRLKKINLVTRKLPKKPIAWILKYLEFIIRSIFRGFFGKYDVYHCHDLNTLLVGVILSKMKRKKVIFDSHEIFTRMSGVKMRSLWEKLEKWLVRYVDIVILTDNYRVEVFRSLYPDVQKTGIVMNVPELGNLIPLEVGLKEHLQVKEGEKLGVYFGAMQPKRFLEETILSAQYLPAWMKIALVGPTSIEYREKLNQIIQTHQLSDQVFVLEPVPRDQLISYVSEGDFSFVFYSKDDLNNKYCSPNKLFESLHAGLPMVTSDNPLIMDVLAEQSIGVSISEVTPESIARAALELLQRLDFADMRENCIALGNKYNWQMEEKNLLTYYAQLLTCNQLKMGVRL